MEKGKIVVAGIGPGSSEDITPAVLDIARQADVVIGYKYYFRFIASCLNPQGECIDSGMRQERDRARQAFEQAESGKTVLVISSGDAGIYGMAPLVYEMKRERGSDVDIISLPGISAFQKAAALLGAPTGHDFCVVSLSDIMTPWERIETRIKAAAEGDFVTIVYNPRSNDRFWQISRLKELFLSLGRSADTPVGIVRQAGRPGQTCTVTTLGTFVPESVDMLTVVLIGNSQTYVHEGKMITPRGYYFAAGDGRGAAGTNAGQDIMTRSFRTIMRELEAPRQPPGKMWALLHAIHATADFDMEDILYVDDRAVERMYEGIASGGVKTIVTDVSMVASGVRKGALKRRGVDVRCYITDPRAVTHAHDEHITRAQAGMRLAADDCPDALYVFGNAPTALMELCALIRKGKARPAGIIAAPVGFVHVREAKYMVKTFTDIPKIIVEGRKGGSGLAAALTNAVLCFDDAAAMRPGRDV